MPLSVKTMRAGLRALLTLGLWLFGLQVGGWALEGEVRHRSPFCLAPEPDPQKECVARFFLNPGEKVTVLSLSIDKKWLQVRYNKNQQKGWLKAGHLALTLPTGLKPETVYEFETKASFPPVFIQGQAGQVLFRYGGDLYRIEDGQVKPQGPLRYLEQGAALSPGHLTPDQVTLYRKVKIEEALFIQESHEPLAGTPPRFRSLLRLDDDWHEAYIAEREGILFVLGRGMGYWGNNLLTGLNQAGLPVIKFQEPAELFRFLPGDIRNFVIPDTLFFSALDNQGQLFVTAQQRSGQGFILIKVAPALGDQWDYQGFIPWPKELIPHKPKKKSPLVPIQLRSASNATFFVYYPPGQAPILHYFTLTGTLRFQKALPQLHDLILDSEQRLWTLEGQKLIRWTPIY